MNFPGVQKTFCFVFQPLFSEPCTVTGSGSAGSPFFPFSTVIKTTAYKIMMIPATILNVRTS